MGLDINVYTSAELVPASVCAPGDYCDNEAHVAAVAYLPFVQSMRGLRIAPGVKYGKSEFLGGHCYDTSSGNRWYFRAGSYGGYNAFRRALCEAALGMSFDDFSADPDAFRNRPFFELLWFADNEGTIGPEAALDLAADFDEHRQRVWPQLEGWHQGSYDEWAKAFTDAARGGLVEFG